MQKVVVLNILHEGRCRIKFIKILERGSLLLMFIVAEDEKKFPRTKMSCLACNYFDSDLIDILMVRVSSEWL
jgi:hypothetical protein